MKNLICILSLLSLCAPRAAQSQQVFEREKRDYTWLLGYGGFAGPPFGGMRLDFNTSPPSLGLDLREMGFEATNGSICSSAGQLLLYTNGIYIAGGNHEPIENGTGINPGPWAEQWAYNGLPIIQGALWLPAPGHEASRYHLFHETRVEEAEPNPYGYTQTVRELYCTTVELTDAHPEGEVVEKNVAVIRDTLDYGKITAVRHANGRDWWVVAPEYFSNGYYRLLVGRDTVANLGKQVIGDSIPSGVGQAVFSPDGAKYIRYNVVYLGLDQYLDIFDFDRCTATLSNPRHIIFRDTSLYAGVVVSENSRFLYVSSNRYVYQYDLEAPDIEASRQLVATYDGFTSPTIYQTRFHQAQLAPNGKAYIAAPTTTDYVHVIHQPNQKGPACNLEQHAIQLPRLNKRTMPNYPYYGLGPADGTPCDSLGIDNPPPQAMFSYVAGSASIAFYDGSLYSPTSWHWEFGDGSSSDSRHPEHAYAAPGAYQACLTVSNSSGQDMYCTLIELLVSGAGEAPGRGAGLLRAYPNPAVSIAYIGYQLDVDGIIQLLDINGRLQALLPAPAAEQQARLDVSGLAPGLYWVRLVGPAGTAGIVKLAVAR